MSNESVHTASAAEAEQFALEAGLSAGFAESFMRWYAPATAEVAHQTGGAVGTVFVGISGCQGSGKSTLAALAGRVLAAVHELNVAVLSLDDFYLTRSERRRLAADCHPLFATRGVPGTHDTALLIETCEAMAAGQGRVRVPTFDKARDDRAPVSEWPQYPAPIDVVVLEGWCVGVVPQTQDALAAPINALEAEQDPDGRWRREVNRQLGAEYAEVFRRLDTLWCLQAPGFAAVTRWRWQQEQALSRRFRTSHPDLEDPTMSESEVSLFVRHFQRITEHALDSLPDTADHVWRLADDRSVLSYQARAHI